MPPWPLQSRLLLITTGLFGLALLLVFALMLQQDWRQLKQAHQLTLQLQLETLARDLERAAPPAELAAQRLALPDIVGVSRQSPDGQIRWQFGDLGPPHDRMTLLLGDNDWLHLQANRQHLHYALLLSAGQLMLIGLAVLLMLNLVLRWLLTRAWQPLLDYLRQLSPAHASPVPVQTASGRLWPDLPRLVEATLAQLRDQLDNLQQSSDLAEEDLRRALESVERQNIELHAARREAVASNQLKSGFLANISHEIRTPLNSLVGFAHLLERSPLGPEQLAHVRNISRSAEHLLAILNDLLDLSKIEAGKLVLDETPVDLRELVSQTMDLMQPLILDKPVALQAQIDPDTPASILGDPLRLRQILCNLLSNAVKFTPRGQIHVRLQTTVVDTQRVDLTLSVTDTGIGMSEAELPLLFDAFHQADSSTSRRYGGSGLGLPITRQLIELMQGRIEVQSNPGRGSCFTVSWRAQVDPFETLATLPDAIHGERVLVPLDPPLQVLVVDDHPANLQLMTALLKDFGIQAVCVDNGREAVHLALQSPFDLIFMDIQMPGMNGIETTRAIREGEQHGHRVPIVALTAHAMRSGSENTLIDDYLSKPLQPRQLLHILQQWTRFTSPPPAIIDWREARQLAAGKTELAQQLLTTLVKDLVDTRQRLQTCWQQQDVSGWRSELHRLLGACRYCGVPALRTRLELLMAQREAAEIAEPDYRALLGDIDNLLQHRDLSAVPSG